jgi:hypothetical protein
MDNILPTFQSKGITQCLAIKPSTHTSGDSSRKERPAAFSNQVEEVKKSPTRPLGRPKLLKATNLKSAYDKSTNPSPLLISLNEDRSMEKNKNIVPKVGKKSAGQIRREQDITRYRKLAEAQAEIDASHDTVVVNLTDTSPRRDSIHHHGGGLFPTRADIPPPGNNEAQLDFFTQSRTFRGKGSRFFGGRQALKTQGLHDPETLLCHEQVNSQRWMISRSRSGVDSTPPRRLPESQSILPWRSFPGIVLALCPLPCAPEVMQRMFPAPQRRSRGDVSAEKCGLKVYLSEQSNLIRISKLHCGAESLVALTDHSKQSKRNSSLKTHNIMQGGRQWDGVVEAGDWLCVQDASTHSQLVICVGNRHAERGGERTIIWNTSASNPSMSMTHKNPLLDCAVPSTGEDAKLPNSDLPTKFAFNLSLTVVSPPPKRAVSRHRRRGST